MHRLCSLFGMTASLPAFALVACAQESLPPLPDDDPDTGRDALRLDVGSTGGVEIYGVAPPPRPETGERPRYELYAKDDRGGDPRPLDIRAKDAVIDEETGTLAWIGDENELWLAPADRAPEGRREVAAQAIVGLAAQGGQVAFAVRIDGPETAPMIVDVDADEVRALDSGPGSDEVLGFSPSGDEVLLLSGRTGVASLFAASLDQTPARQLTNIGLEPGPELDADATTPAPSHRADIAWEREGIAFRADDAVLRIAPGGEVRTFDADTTLDEALQKELPR